MKTTFRPALGFALILALASGAPRAEVAPLTPDALARCASQVQTLREESVRLVSRTVQFDQRRILLNRRSDLLATERASLGNEDLAKGMDYQQRNQQHRSEILAFNGQVEDLKRDITAVNALKNDYDSSCARRPYRRADLDAMPEAARNAMRTGLADVQVPYLDGSVLDIR